MPLDPPQHYANDPDDRQTPAPAITHDPPSLPASPLPKRTKIIDEEKGAPAAAASSRLGAAAAVTSVSAATTGSSTPTPMTPTHPHPHHTHKHHHHSAHQNGMMQQVQAMTMATIVESVPPLQVKKLVPNARAPTRGSAFAAGYDLYSAAPATIPARGRALVSTGIAISVPAGTYGRVAPRSGLAAKHGIDVGAGVIDADYRGEVKVLLFNLSELDFEVAEGERVAQLVVERIYTPNVVVVEELEESVRGAGGFGSTGGFGGAPTTTS